MLQSGLSAKIYLKKGGEDVATRAFAVRVYTSPNKNILGVIKLTDTNWAGNVVRMGKNKNGWKLLKKTPLAKS
jgi:hypothetical protein